MRSRYLRTRQFFPSRQTFSVPEQCPLLWKRYRPVRTYRASARGVGRPARHCSQKPSGLRRSLMPPWSRRARTRPHASCWVNSVVVSAVGGHPVLRRASALTSNLQCLMTRSTQDMLTWQLITSMRDISPERFSIYMPNRGGAHSWSVGRVYDWCDSSSRFCSILNSRGRRRHDIFVDGRVDIFVSRAQSDRSTRRPC